jgi:hypothetical protein
MKKEIFGVFPKNDPIGKAKKLIDKTIDDNGFLKNTGNKQDQKKAIKLLSQFDFDYLMHRGFSIHNALLLIAYPNKSI